MTQIFSKTTVSIEEMREIVKLVNLNIKKNTILLLSGELGAGKTTFVSLFCELHNIFNVQSPSYSIHQRYINSNNLIIDHFDLYRLENEDEIQSSGFFDLISEYTDYKFIEWANRVELNTFSQTDEVYLIQFNINQDSSRQIVLNKIN